MTDRPGLEDRQQIAPSFISVADGALRLEARHDDATWLPSWLPRPHPTPAPARFRLSLRPMTASEQAQLAAVSSTPATLSFGSVRAWVDASNRAVRLSGRAGSGTLDLAAGHGAIDPAGSPEEGCTLLTMAAGLLLAAGGRALLHAGAVRRPDGGVLLLVGDTHSGKSTTTLTLARAPGWAWLSDDQVVLAPGPEGSIEVLAWVRRPHLDRGYLRGESTGARGDADEGLLASLEWQARGRLAGVLLPRVQADAPSRAGPAPAADGLAALIRQGAWMVAEPTSARTTLELLRIAAGTGCRHLDLGRDCYGQPGRLVALVEG